jgi:hypothetical protein
MDSTQLLANDDSYWSVNDSTVQLLAKDDGYLLLTEVQGERQRMIVIGW